MKVTYNRVGGVMVSVLVSVRQILCSNPGSDQTKDYNIDMCCFTNKHEASRSKNKDWLSG